jgi:hypothetical protein
MLPNWLYGKSKSKLASILGGGGTPTDYDQVKAQVTQNAEDITALFDNMEVNGAVNMLLNNVTTQTISGITFTANNDGTVTANGTVTQSPSAAGGTSTYITGLVVGETYVLSGLPESTALSGSEAFIKLYKNDNSYSEIKTTGSKTLTFTYDGTNAKVIDFGIRTVGTVVTNAVFKPMICLKSLYDADPTYVPYAMTNRELTEKLTSDANLGTAVDLSAYTAYSNMFTAPSDGYVHFQSGASGSQVRTIYTYGNNTTAAADSHFTHTTSANNKAFEVYVRKGLKIYADGLQSDDTINFYSLL